MYVKVMTPDFVDNLLNNTFDAEDAQDLAWCVPVRCYTEGPIHNEYAKEYTCFTSDLIMGFSSNQ